MARLLVGNDQDLHNIEIYDPSAGTGTLLIALAHQIGEENCTIYSQDISQKSNEFLRLNLILNNLVQYLPAKAIVVTASAIVTAAITIAPESPFDCSVLY